jgi:hypothetical protein
MAKAKSRGAARTRKGPRAAKAQAKSRPRPAARKAAKKAARAKPAGTKASGRRRKSPSRSRRGRTPARQAARKPAARKAATKKRARPAARKAATKAITKRAAAKKAVAKKAVVKKAVVKKAVVKPAPARTAVARKAVPAKPVTRTPAPSLRPARAATAPRPAPKPRRQPESAHPKPPSLERARRRLPEADDLTLPTPPSSLDLDRTASAARTGQAEIAEALAEHTETGPEITAGDVDANWESAYSTGDEAPGGDNPTPDQDVVDEIGKSLGLVYEDNEELQGANKITERDKHRWELDPASSEDFDER